jgi:hypothetical protein
MVDSVRVALVRTSPATVLADYARLLDLIDIPADSGRSYALRIAIDRRLPFPGSSAPPWQTAGVTRALRQLGYVPRSASLSHPDPDDLHGHRRPMIEAGLTDFSTSAHPADLQVALAPLRRGPGQPYTGVGRLCLPDQRPLIAVLDGAMIGNGPVGAATDPEVGNLLIASHDPGAADLIGARLLGMDLPAHVMIDVVGDRALLDQRWRLISARAPRRAAHDSFDAWGFRDQQIYTSWISHTGWGQLFRAYHRPQHSTGA